MIRSKDQAFKSLCDSQNTTVCPSCHRELSIDNLHDPMTFSGDWQQLQKQVREVYFQPQGKENGKAAQKGLDWNKFYVYICPHCKDGTVLSKDI